MNHFYANAVGYFATFLILLVSWILLNRSKYRPSPSPFEHLGFFLVSYPFVAFWYAVYRYSKSNEQQVVTFKDYLYPVLDTVLVCIVYSIMYYIGYRITYSILVWKDRRRQEKNK